MKHKLKRNSKWILCVLSVGVILLLLVVSNHNTLPVQAKNHQQIISTLGSVGKAQQNNSIINSMEIEQAVASSTRENLVTEQKQSDSAKDNVGMEQQDTIPELTHQNIVELTDRFMNTLVQPIDDNYRVLNYATIDELMDVFSVFIDREVVAEYVNFYFHEEADGIYILPTETPPWFEENNDYKVQQVSENKAMVNQYNESELHGNYTVSIEFTYDGSAWRITGIAHQY
ncbi:hypothetical protein [Oceanobacillus chungangensis]|uniref:Uncharacterized protein n=1 Tax=Oceanobacillus chungangensis TaxID=1229152 RepID=A0A3D8PZI0_9BACI|nr:hypothetical protein [Oceanobacillus chungangensis]RDW20987.1 hypothetical protein CWR45_03840 [Oceanobacillus chungangensis]